jgi:Na+/melibiose symporter-like transporter
MIEPELKQELDKVNTNLITLTKKVGGTWSSLFKGLLSGFGSVIGVAIALMIIDWMLNTLGYIPTFRQQTNDWKQIIQKAQDATPLKQGK